ncbi:MULTISPECIES: large conductance mechanosensitive channel protein MscL [Nocardia]|uniref:Large-conductance mechanosensitive channel n=1 Tax=Nocardia vulneris TaxID=1141657 RepID=A0ABR4Z9R9_9NOCA|nr:MULTISPECIES: large conductance mechanosensitive channel protein MscL [Nocardia]ASF11564.1 large conductance mechanosensitive channel protein MscL [Nocardia brasiliensis]KIA62021.1 mechanosensitive ion channel protein MscL [Nocardia vulneris]GAJ82638.1 large-conductance mechanosensitive channel [Nocardia brasiliensis NBRC 14402]SUB09659.1 Large-conductance mechanosensitive channel [Nocardia brasiliensis]
MLKGFKDFLFRGNVVDLAVAVVIGTAFVAIVTAFTNGIVNPILAVFGGSNELGLGFQLVADKPATFVQVGPIITAAINFAIIAAVLYFVLVLPATHVKKKFSKEAVELSDTELLIQIRDLLAEGQRSAGGKHES